MSGIIKTIHLKVTGRYSFKTAKNFFRLRHVSDRKEADKGESAHGLRGQRMVRGPYQKSADQ